MTRVPFDISSRDAGNHREQQQILVLYFIALVITHFLWGVQITQSYNYYKSYRKTDNIWTKGAVGLLFVIGATQSICVSAGSWCFLVQDTGSSPGIHQLRWGGNMVPFLDASTASIVHTFYAHKIWVLLMSPHKYICAGSVLGLSCLQLVGGLGSTILMFNIKIKLYESDRPKVWISIWLVTAAVTDVVITSIITWKLSKLRTGFKRNDDVISKLIRIVVETGLATAIVQGVNIVLYLLWPHAFYHVVPAFIGPKVYGNSMLALLNSRRRIRVHSSLMWESQKGGGGKSEEDIQMCTTQTDRVQIFNSVP